MKSIRTHAAVTCTADKPLKIGNLFPVILSHEGKSIHTGMHF